MTNSISSKNWSYAIVCDAIHDRGTGTAAREIAQLLPSVTQFVAGENQVRAAIVPPHSGLHGREVPDDGLKEP